MSITELINKVGNNVQCQWIDESCTNTSIGKRDATLQIHTSISNGNQVQSKILGLNPTHRGLIVWVPIEALEGKE